MVRARHGGGRDFTRHERAMRPPRAIGAVRSRVRIDDSREPRSYLSLRAVRIVTSVVSPCICGLQHPSTRRGRSPRCLRRDFQAVGADT